jgi:hypothetical protein
MALELFGTLLMGIGGAKKFGGIDFLPAITRFDESGWLMIGLGFLLTLPFLFYIVMKVLEKAEQSITK